MLPKAVWKEWIVMADVVFDLGQTQARVRVCDASHVIDEFEADGFSHGSELPAIVTRLVGMAADRSGLDSFDAVAGGCTGLYGHAPVLGGLGESLHLNYGVSRLFIADDAVTSYLGALGNEQGALAAVGTGLVTLALGPAGPARVDGVGAMIGDNGAGWWIGRSGAIAALSTKDGRSNGSADLLAALEERFGAAEMFPHLLASQPSPIATVASFAVDVAAVARAGDSVAQQIWRDAARYIADSLVAASRMSGLTGDLRWCITGRIGSALDLLEPALGDDIRAVFPAAKQSAAKGTSLDGAARLLDHPSLVQHSSMVGEYTHS